MRTMVWRYCLAPACTRRVLRCDLLRNTAIFSTPQRIRLSQHSPSFSTFPLSTPSSPSFTCFEVEEQQKTGLSIAHGEGASGFLNTHKTEDILVRSIDPENSGDEDEHGHDYVDVGSKHVPVLLSEVLAAFQSVQLHTFVDCTLGAAGHASSIIVTHPELKSFIGLDVDPVAQAEASSRLQEAIEQRTKACTNLSDLKVNVLKANFKSVKHALRQLGLEHGEVDGVLMDLGMSSMQLNVADRGFSLQLDGPLDMRMDPVASTTASDIVNSWPEAEIGRIIREYGEERQWKRLAKKISEAQHSGGIHSTSALLQLIQKSLPTRFSPGRPGWKKTAVRVFQALRIAVNDELSSLEAALPDAFECLKPGGRLAVISFHSLEDRIVKQFFLKVMGETVVSKSNKYKESKYNPSMNSSMEREGGELRTRGMKVLEGTHASILTKRPLTAGLDEVKSNPRARSAKLRILVKN
ncbi:hypothetical protein GOP47_0005188 [Adiantum capillus-veneris]|uniref:Uncharacterized protein n=1 Tax=Adiantum capillus-veneris TaxID=13818 RepID=A0A9D4V4N7_ADICA|nr:hypothetical protein GOP47_0005188 [Adiantum capillus-veneris]